MQRAPYERLAPHPRRIEAREGALELPRDVSLAAGGLAPTAAEERLRRALERTGRRLVVPGGGAPLLRLAERRVEGGAEAYELEVHADHVVLAASEPPGFHHGLRTLAHAIELQADAPLPCVRVADAPGLRVRGAMLDVSRNRVPTMETLFRIVERLADWKYNQLQLYTEHTFAYAGHEEVWRGRDPLTPEEIRRLDRFCAERFIELVPNQQSFGHMHHWLRHARYNDLAEVPEGVEHPFAFEPEPFSLAPRDPRSLALLEDLYDQLLPCFSSRSFNVGLDETFDLGQGRSREAVEREGVAAVYLGFLREVEERVRARGRRMHFWADVLLNHPEHTGELPEGVVPNLWGYEAGHPFEEECARVAAAGLDFVVCPGTSSWQTIGGRLANMRGNVESAVRNARASGALGVLVTDWGDRGHLQPLPVSYPGWLALGAAAWNPDAAPLEPAELGELLSRDVFDDSTGRLGRAWIRLAEVGEACGPVVHNASPLSLLLTKALEPFPCNELRDLDAAGLDRASLVLDEARSLGSEHAARSDDAELATSELEWCARLMRLALDLGRARLEDPRTLEELAPSYREGWKRELESATEELRSLWLARSRAGGLDSSARWLTRISERL